MATVRMNFDDGALRRVAGQATAAWAAQMQPHLDRLADELHGVEEGEARKRLAEIWRQHAGRELSEEQLVAYTPVLVAGRRIELKVTPS